MENQLPMQDADANHTAIILLKDLLDSHQINENDERSLNFQFT